MHVELFLHSTQLNFNNYMGDSNLVELYSGCKVNCVYVCG